VDHIDVAVDAGVHVGPERPRQAADPGRETEGLDGFDDLVLGVRGCGKARFDGLDSYGGELLCNTEFLLTGE
jgi:hypothetical protein